MEGDLFCDQRLEGSRGILIAQEAGHLSRIEAVPRSVLLLAGVMCFFLQALCKFQWTIVMEEHGSKPKIKEVCQLINKAITGVLMEAVCPGLQKPVHFYKGWPSHQKE